VIDHEFDSSALLAVPKLCCESRGGALSIDLTPLTSHSMRFRWRLPQRQAVLC
jgi:hypothetical protein